MLQIIAIIQGNIEVLRIEYAIWNIVYLKNCIAFQNGSKHDFYLIMQELGEKRKRNLYSCH